MSVSDSTTIEGFLKPTDLGQQIYDNFSAPHFLSDRRARRSTSAQKNLGATVIGHADTDEHGAASTIKRAEKTMEKRLTCSIKESAELLGVHENTIRNHIRSGRLEASHLGRRHLVSMKSIREIAGLPQVAA